MLFRSSRTHPTFPEGWNLLLQSGPGAPVSLPLTSGALTLGRDPGCEICLQEDHRISRRHARITYEEGEWLLDDLDSANGTFVGRERVLRATPLEPGDKVTLGQTVLVLQQPNGTPALKLVGSDFDGLETQFGETDAALAGLLSSLDTEIDAAPTPLPPSEPEVLPEPEGPEQPPAETEESPVAVAEPALDQAELETEPEAPKRPPPIVAAPSFSPPAAVMTPPSEGAVRLEWTPEGLGARLRLPGGDAAFAGRVHSVLADLRPPSSISATLTETLGEPGLCLQLQAAPGAQPQLLLVAGDIITRLATAAVCDEVLLPTSR